MFCNGVGYSPVCDAVHAKSDCESEEYNVCQRPTGITSRPVLIFKHSIAVQEVFITSARHVCLRQRVDCMP